jgi:hypothetical protein
MAADLIHPDDRPHPAARFRAHLASYLRGLPAPELAELLAGLPDPVTVDLIAELAARGPAHARLPVTWPGHPDTELLRRRSLREVVADRRAARAARRAGAPPGATLADWAANRPLVIRPGKDPAVERRLGEALRGRAAERGERDDLAAMAFDDPGCPRRASPSRPPRAGGTGGCPTSVDRLRLGLEPRPLRAGLSASLLKGVLVVSRECPISVARRRDLNCPCRVVAGALPASIRPLSRADAEAQSRAVSPRPVASRQVP